MPQPRHTPSQPRCARARYRRSAVAEAALARIAARDREFNAFTTVTRERAFAEAAAVDRALAQGRDPGPLAGVPFAVKNLFDIAGIATIAGSKINRDAAPAAHDATLIERLGRAGAVLLGALNMGEYAYDFTGENVHDGPSRNPRDPKRMSGGSSGGSGTAVAGGLVPLALGSDTNGSIRVPSALCGLFGLKPTYGRLSRRGSFPFVNSLDHLGPLGRSTATSRSPMTRCKVPTPPMPPAPNARPSRRCPRSPRASMACASPWPAAISRRAARRKLIERSRPSPRRSAPRAASSCPRRRAPVPPPSSSPPRRAARLHLDRLRRRAADFDPATRDRLIAGALTPAAWYVQAQRFRRWYHAAGHEIIPGCRRPLAPATPVSAPLIGQKTMTLDGKEMQVRANLGIFTQPISFVGLPVVAVPVMRRGAMPLGVQVIAAPWQEATALRVAAALEAEGVCAAPVA